MKLNKILLTSCALPIAVTPAISIASCSNDKQLPIAISGKPIVDLNTPYQIKYVGIDSAGRESACKWSVDDDQLATIDENTGILTPKQQGVVNITAIAVKDKTITAQLPVTITDKWPAFSTAWSEALTRFKSTKGKYTSATLDESSTHQGKTLYSYTAAFTYFDEVTTSSWGQIKLHLTNVAWRYVYIGPEVSGLEARILKMVSKTSKPSIELINDDTTIGIKINDNDILAYSYICDKDLYLKELIYQIGETNKHRHYIINQYNKS